jgi:hypothetical protein
MRAKRKTQQGYDPSPPCCSNCVLYQPPSPGVPRFQMPYLPPRCKKGDFTVNPDAICNEWQGLDGSRLSE